MRTDTVRCIPVPVDTDVVKVLKITINDKNSELFFDNPVISGLINCAWKDAIHLYLAFWILFLCYLVFFDIFIWQYIYQENSNYIIAIFLFFFGTFYALFGLARKGGRSAFYNIVDVGSLILPLVVTAVLTSRAARNDNGVWGFGQTEVDGNILILISFSTFTMWFQLLLLLRQFEGKTLFFEFRVFYIILKPLIIL